MAEEIKTCVNCASAFTITPEVADFYRKLDVLPPTHCPDCRAQRRYSWRNDRNLYRQNCGLCGKSTVTMYSPNKPFTVYCQPCWWGDSWDGLTYGQDYDFDRPFFEQFKELQSKVPRIALVAKNSINSEYINHSADDKNCYMCASAMRCEDVMYSNFIIDSRDSVDCAQAYEKLERCYECIDCRNSYQCRYGFLLKDCSNCMYCYDCRGCTDCVLSWNLRNKSYCFMNEELSKEEYEKKLKEFNMGSHKDRERLYAQYLDLMEEKALHRYASMEQCVTSVGDYLYGTKNAVECFDSNDCEDVKYAANITDGKTTMDAYRCAEKIELVHECHALIRTYNISFCNMTYDDSHIQYCDHCFNSQNLFGCIGLKKNEYCILNKRYDKKSFEELKAKIVEHMRSTGEYGEFFPTATSPFGYNETHGQIFFPLSKEEVLKKGWKWEDEITRTSGKETLAAEAIPDDIEDAGDDILQQVLKCASCGMNYNIVAPELSFYRKEHIPLPRLCFPCRDNRRIKLRTPRKLFKRACQCAGDSSDDKRYGNMAKNHPPHKAEERCPNTFQTAYAPDRKETVYCEECYQQEVL